MTMTAAAALLPIEANAAGWLSDLFKSSAKPAKAHHARAASRKPVSHDKHTASAKRHTDKPIRLASLGPTDLGRSSLEAGPAGCDPLKFRIVLDVGHTAESEGAISARNIPEFAFNLHLAQRIEEKLKAAFPETKLIVTEGRARPSLFTRVATASRLHANLLLSIHHDAVPDKFLEDWDFDGKKSHFSDRFSGYSVWVSHDNPQFRTSLSFAELIGRQMKAQGLQYAQQYTQPIMGHYRFPLLDKEAGVYSHDELIVLRKSQMPAVLLEAGSIINRDEELKMNSPERQDVISNAVLAAAKDFCPAYLGPM
jgi:N-acetylmuramoyl-L-alanine amidase